MQKQEREVIWLGDSLDQIHSFPEAVKKQVGFAVHLAQTGDMALNAVPLLGYKGSRVVEVVAPFDGNTYRAVYTVEYLEVVYVLHAFQKKSVRGKATPRRDVVLINSRLKDARAHHEQHYGKKRKQETIKKTETRNS